ncbi:MAG: DUF4392 domain-containing protein [Selenomonadaceae bacterium]|nr:DUF4392 domain-containing protein [Selenomonadaceae bacterium]
MERIEDIILRHSQRGMTKLRPCLKADYCRLAAEEIYSWKRGVIFLTTGFYVAGFPETDGPTGTAVLASVLRDMGFTPVIVTEPENAELFTIRGFEVIPAEVGVDVDFFRQMISERRPVGMISVERCGLNAEDDYANMRGISIREHNAPTDVLFQIAPEYDIRTVGVGDGGNEIGMGNVADVIEKDLSLVPCVVKVDYLVIASVSNWGAYGLAAYLSILDGKHLMPSYAWAADYMKETVEIGSVDGITHERVTHVDGFDESVEQEIIDALAAEIDAELAQRAAV